VPPAPASTRARYADSERYARIVRQVTAGGGGAPAEARAKLDIPAELDAVYFTDVIHPSCLGHARVAEAVSEAMLTLDLPGVPAAPLAYSGDFLALKPLQAGARHEAGVPLAEVPAAKAAELDSRLLLLPSPHRVTFRGVKVFDGAELRAETGIYDGNETVKGNGVKPDGGASAPGAADVVFRVEVVSGGARREVLRAAVPRRGLGTWTPLTRQVADLRPFAGETVDLVLTCEGEAPFVAWGKPILHAAGRPSR
jgi:hypothetical protein